MQIINIYRYIRSDGGVTVSTILPNVEHDILYRLVADDGMMLTDGSTKTPCVDTDDVSLWSEIPDNHDTDLDT